MYRHTGELTFQLGHTKTEKVREKHMATILKVSRGHYMPPPFTSCTGMVPLCLCYNRNQRYEFCRFISFSTFVTNEIPVFL